eukprot:6184249-Pleurochrysis_carterae.AAC.1
MGGSMKGRWLNKGYSEKVGRANRRTCEGSNLDINHVRRPSAHEDLPVLLLCASLVALSRAGGRQRTWAAPSAGRSRASVAAPATRQRSVFLATRRVFEQAAAGSWALVSRSE